ncbi:MAG: hypothetical protein ACOYEV_09045 [Candidatus Nanopelagicales bacterium]
MSLQYLAADGAARIERGDRGELEIELTVRGASARLRVSGLAPGYQPISHKIADHQLLTVPEEPLRVWATPHGEFFPDGTTVQVTIRSQTGGRASQVVGPQMDVGALPEVAVAEIAPLDAQFTQVSAVKLEIGGPSEGLCPLARAAHSVARRLAWADRIDPTPGGLVLCLDSSASMAVLAEQGLLQVLVEVVLGVDRGLGDGGTVPVLALGAGAPQRLPGLDAENSVSYVAQCFADLATSTGFRASALAPEMVPAEAALVLIVTDALPPDLAACHRRWQDAVPRVRVLVLGPGAEEAASPPASGIEIGYIDPAAWVPLPQDHAELERSALEELILALLGPARGQQKAG